MRKLLTIGLSMFVLSVFGQTKIHQTFPIDTQQEVSLNFDFPQLIKLSTWDKNEIEITGTSNINDGKNDASFQITKQSSSQQITIEGKLHDYKNIPQKIIAHNGKEKKVFNSKEELKEYEKTNNVKFSNTSLNSQVEIVLEIKIPRQLKAKIEATYGTIEIKNLANTITAISTYGSVDATIDEKKTGEIKLETFYGTIFTDLKLPMQTTKKEDFHTIITAFTGKNPRQEFSSKFGNIYLRK
ncbi:hypothetical protein [Chishuiella changwenlii]|uniref:hypothetical protein n=1 Tax=Chishuiella changwenlii TaxID=1434701 RepID=UPI002FD9A39D